MSDPVNWSELKHSCGTASDVPQKLKELRDRSDPNSGHDDPLWKWCFDTLVHQGTVYDASVAATPALMAIAVEKPAELQYDFIALVAWIEHCRIATGFSVSEPLRVQYQSAVATCLDLAIALIADTNDHQKLLVLMHAIAVGNRDFVLAERLSKIDYIPDDDLHPAAVNH